MIVPAVRLVARQPILDRSQQIFGYELLFRPDPEVNANPDPGREASLELIGDSLMLHELHSLVPHGRAFVNLTRADLLAGHARYLPKELAVIEILETVPAQPEVMKELGDLRDAGYVLALDDVHSPGRLLDFADVVHLVKVDLAVARRPDQQKILKVARAKRIKALAEKVETKAEFRDLAALGFEYFQGYFFARPEVLRQRDAAAGALSRLRLLESLHRSEFDPAEFEQVVQSEPAFAYKLLRYLNSPLFGFRSIIDSIRHAITLLGEQEVRRWATLVALQSMAETGSPELALTAVRRAMFCEELAACGTLGIAPDRLFLAGLLNSLDGILDRPIEDLVRQLPLHPEIAIALLLGDSNPGTALRLVEAYDMADWKRVGELAARLDLSDEQLLSGYRAAVSRSQKILTSLVP